MLGHEVVELRLLLGREYLNHLRFNSRFLHNHLSHGLRLLSCESAHLRFVKGSRHCQLTNLLMALCHLLHQRLQRRFFFRHNVFHLRLLRICEVKIVGEEMQHVAFEHSITMHVCPPYGLRYSHCRRQREHKRQPY